MASKKKDILVFLEQHPVFTMSELRGYFSLSQGAREASDILLHNKRMGRIGAVKEGVYYVVRPGNKPATTHVDPFLLCSKLAPDAVLAFHTALEILGFGHSVFNTHYYFSNRFRAAVRFRHDRFRAVLTPNKLRKQSLESFGTEKVERLGQKVVVTGKERTLVEVLERPQYCGGFEETYRCLEKMPYFQPEIVLEYLELRNHKSLYARVGFFLEQHREDFHTEESLLVQLERNKPTQPIYWSLHGKGGVLIKRWNLIVPNAVRERSWEEG